MKKIAFLVLIAVVLSLFGCSSPAEPKESEILSGGAGCEINGVSYNSGEFYNLMGLMDADSRREMRPKNMVMWNDVSFLGKATFFQFAIGGYSIYQYNFGDYSPSDFCLYCYHDGAEWSGEPTIDQFTPTSISEEMTDMLNFPSNGKTMYVISRNGFDYCYNKDGTLESLQWHIDNIRFKFVCSSRVLTTDPPPVAIISGLLSTDDDVAFAAMDEIIDKLSNRPPYVPKETTAESTPAQ